MKLKTEFINGCLKISLTGELDHHCAGEMLSAIGRALDDYMPRKCVLDMSSVSFMDSSGIALILRVYKQMRECGGQAFVAEPQRQPLKVMESAGIDRLVKILTAIKEGDR